MNFKDTVDQFDISIRVLKQPIKPRFEKNELANLSFEQWDEAYLAEDHYENYLPNKQLGILIPKPIEAQAVWTEFGKDDHQYFYLSTIPPIIQKEKKNPQRIAIIWDHSHSATKRNLEKELEILNRYLQQLENVHVLLIPFANTLNTSAAFDIQGGNWAELQQEITSLANDGATQFGVLDLNQYSPDEFLLFSDGNSNFGSDSIQIGSKPVYVINSSPTGNHPFLNYIAQTSGGQYLNLSEYTLEAGMEMLTYQTYRFIKAEYDQTQIAEIYPSNSTPVNGAFSMSGKVLNGKPSITLSFGIGEKVLHKKTVEIIPQQASLNAIGLDRIWAQKYLSELMVKEDENKEDIVALGKQFSIVTPHTSLIVLDRVEDYAEHEILPPEELLDTYNDLLAQKEKNREIELLSHLDQIAEAFSLRKDWWKQKFKIPQKPVKSTSSGRTDTLSRQANESILGNSSNEESSFGALADAFGETEDDIDYDGVPAMEDAEPGSPEPTPQAPSGTIKLNVWNPETPYTQKLSEALPSAFYSTYLELKKEYATTPAFFLDVANLAYQKGDSVMALKILSNIAELELENHELMRVLARRLQQLGEYSLAISIFEEIIRIRGEEPQSYRDMGLVLAELGKDQAAIEMLYEVVSQKWDDRFPEIGVLAAHEMNAIIGRSKRKLELEKFDQRLIADLPTDIRVVLDWDADAVDMDLWVTDPRGEKCYYQNKRTLIGGFMSSDFTGGYGPEEFLLKKAMQGTYKVQVNYYGSNQQRIAGPTNIQMRLITDYGKPNEKTQSITLRLASESEVIDVGELLFE